MSASATEGLTVNSTKNVLVVIQGERKLQQFTTHGTLLQTIQLQPDIEIPRRVVELSNGQFVISYTGPSHSPHSGRHHRIGPVSYISVGGQGFRYDVIGAKSARCSSGGPSTSPS